MSSDRRKQFPFVEFEPKWQKLWDDSKAFRTPGPGDADFDASKPKYFVLDMFPYPSGAGLHVGHPEGYTATDIMARYKKLCGFNVLHPMGYDAFGLPAEEHARKTGEHPAINTAKNIANFQKQLKMLGFAYDWDRELSTTDPEYVKWTQWIFLQLYSSYFDEDAGKAKNVSELEAKGWTRDQIDEVRLAFVANTPVWWSPDLGTVLANEEVEEWKGKGHTVERRPLRQWMLRITKYAQRLIDELDTLDWPEGIKLLQKNWIGRSEGAEVKFDVEGREVIVFTTRPDTLFGATYMVLAPEHPFVSEITTDKHKSAVEAYQKSCLSKSDLDRGDLNKDKSGVFTGAFATNPVNGEKIPVWIADYVMMGYGTGAIMAVPAHDERDFEFAKRFNLEIIPVVKPPDEWLKQNFNPLVLVGIDPSQISTIDFSDAELLKDFASKISEKSKETLEFCSECIHLQQRIYGAGEASEEDLQLIRTCYLNSSDWFFGQQQPEAYPEIGTAINSGFLDNLPSTAAKSAMIAWLESEGKGKKRTQFKLRDWLFSRQRYWGEPFPIVWRNGKHEAIPESELPLLAPELDDYKPSGTPDPLLSKATAWVELPDGSLRETNTMPQWAGSCWYYLRYCDPKNTERFISKEAESYWTDEKPGMVDLYVGGTEHAVLHLLYARFWHKVLFDLGHLTTPEPFQRLVNQGLILGENGQKMSKSLGNVVNPDDVVVEYGADSLRLYEMFMGPLEQVKPWSMKGVEGVYRFLGRVWRLVIDTNQEGDGVLSAQLKDVSVDKKLNKVLHETIKKVGEDIEKLSFNTAISQMMVLTNAFTQAEIRPAKGILTLLQILNPFAPHIAEELAVIVGDAFPELKIKGLLAHQTWPAYDPAALIEDEVEIVLQVNGKLRDRATVPINAPKEELETLALANARVKEFIGDLTVRKVIVVPNKLVNIVAN